MRYIFSSLVTITLLPLALAQTTSAPEPGQTCTGASSYCVEGPIILRCGENGTLSPGNCADNLNEPPFGATCVQYAPTAASCSALPGPTTTSAPTPGSACTGRSSFCAGADGPIILQCRENGTLLPGNCDDNLNEPQFGAVCVQYDTTDASCSALPSPTGSTPIPTPGGACTGHSAFCVGTGSPIILRCRENGTLLAGNCDDNLNEPPFGAVCVQYDPTDASCSALAGPTTVTGGTGGVGPTPTGNGTLSGSATRRPTTSSRAPIATGAADPGRSWAGAAIAGAAAVIAGGAIVL